MDIPQIGDEALHALLAQDRGPGETAAPLRPVADVLAALREVPSHADSAGAPVGPDPAGRAAHGLCTAYSHAEAQGSAAQQAVAFRKLAATAGGGGKVAAYCASAPRPGAGAHGKPASHATGRATSRPGHTPAGKHKGKAASR